MSRALVAPVRATARAGAEAARAAAAAAPAPLLRAAFSSSSAADASGEQEPVKGRVLPGESAEEAFKRNMREVREWRYHHEAQRRKLSLFLPPGPASASGGQSTTTTTPVPTGSATRLSLSSLLASGAALGHATHALAPAYMPYVYGNRSGLSIIDLDQTLPLLRRAANVVRDVVAADGVVLVVGTREGHKRALKLAEKRIEDNVYTAQQWLPGTLTNSVTYFGIQPMQDKSHLPDLAIFLNPSENLGAIRECTARNVPSIGVVDTDTDPRIVTYPIPANMESLRTTELVLGALSIAGQEGRRLRLRDAAARRR